jgi:hypothetical protein
MGPTCPKASVNSYELKQRNMAEERSHSFLDGCASFSSFGNILSEKRVLSAEEVVGDCVTEGCSSHNEELDESKGV